LVTEAGGEIKYSPVTLSEKRSFLLFLRQTLKEGNYDVLHMHHDYMSGFYLIATIGLPIKRKIVHVHNNDQEIPVRNQRLRKILLNVFRRTSFALADDIVGISGNTLSEYRNNYMGVKPRFSVLYYGISMEKFDVHVDPISLRKELSIPVGGKIVLFIGRMNEAKNPLYIIDILVELLKKRDDVFAVFVGKGEQEASVKKRAEDTGIQKNVRMLGWSDNTVKFLKSADVFVFPRLLEPKEGLGLVVVEAQCAGLPIFITRGIVEDAIILKELVFFEELQDATVWADHIDQQLENEKQINQTTALERMKASRFDLSHATLNLIELYEKHPSQENIEASL
jgi:glycosyltransferase EpsF